MKSNSILIVEDDRGIAAQIRDKLHDRGLHSIIADSAVDARLALKTKNKEIRVALVDVWLATKSNQRNTAGQSARVEGWQLARSIRSEFPHIRIIGMSLYSHEDVREWFAEYGYAFLRKTWLVHGASSDFIDVVARAAMKPYRKIKPRSFIVHGQDSNSLGELVHYLRSTLKWGTPVILRELPAKGRTIIEKFEDAAQSIDLVFVLLTPDDTIASMEAPDGAKRRARQNVIFELGYFYAKLQRTGGRVILLYKGGVELPSDITGLVYVDISKGIESAGELLRRELTSWL